MLYEEIETKLTALLGAEDSLVLPTITHIHMSVIPVLAGGGTIFLDSRAHKTIYDGCRDGPGARGHRRRASPTTISTSSRRCSRATGAARG